MKQLLVLAVAVLYAGTASAQSLGDRFTSAREERPEMVQLLPSSVPEALLGSNVVLRLAQQPGAQAQAKKSFWKSPWLWVAVGAAAVVIVVAASGGYSSNSGGSRGPY